MAETELERTGGHAVEHASHADPSAEPSAAWGWHGEFPRASRIAGWVTVVILLLMLIGNHEGNVENLWLIGLALLLVIILVGDQIRRRSARWR